MKPVRYQSRSTYLKNALYYFEMGGLNKWKDHKRRRILFIKICSKFGKQDSKFET